MADSAGGSQAAAEPQGRGEGWIMIKKASSYFSTEDRNTIADAVAEAEKRTSGEIVPVAATVSGRYDRAEDIFGFLFALVFLAGAECLSTNLLAGTLQWGAVPSDSEGLPLIHTVVILLVGGILGTALATFFPILRQPFIPKKEMAEEVERRAAEAFQKFRVRKTQGAHGVLIYVSVYEQMARVMGDDAIVEKLDQKVWEDICALVVRGMKDGQPGAGYQQAILKCADVLEPHFPVQPGDVNELSNELRIID